MGTSHVSRAQKPCVLVAVALDSTGPAISEGPFCLAFRRPSHPAQDEDHGQVGGGSTSKEDLASGTSSPSPTFPGKPNKNRASVFVFLVLLVPGVMPVWAACGVHGALWRCVFPSTALGPLWPLFCTDWGFPTLSSQHSLFYSPFYPFLSSNPFFRTPAQYPARVLGAGRYHSPRASASLHHEPWESLPASALPQNPWGSGWSRETGEEGTAEQP